MTRVTARVSSTLLAAVLSLASAPAGAVNFAGVDGSVRDGIVHNPPNPQIGIGTGAGSAGRIVMVTSAGVQIFDKTGAAVTAVEPLDTFLGTPVGAAANARVLFDQHSGRFFIVAFEGQTPNPGGNSNLHVSVSTDNAPSDLSTEWMKMSGSVLTSMAGFDTAVVNSGQSAQATPGIGADAASLFVTANLGTFSGSTVTALIGGKIRVFDKSPVTGLLAGVYSFVDIDLPRDFANNRFDVFGLQPAHTYGSTDSGNFYLVNRVLKAGREDSFYRIWEIAGAPAAPVVVRNTKHGWYSGTQATTVVPQAGTPVSLDGSGTSINIMNALYRDGHVWLTMSAMFGAPRSRVLWAKIATNGGAPDVPRIAEMGKINGADGPESVLIPAIAVNAAGDAANCYTQSYFDQFPEIRAAVRTASDPFGEFQPSAVVGTSVGFYDQTSFPGFNIELWGAYAAAAVDPDDDLTFWCTNENVAVSAVDASTWGTRVVSLDAVTPAPPQPPVAEAADLVFLELHSTTALGGDTPTLFQPSSVGVSPDGRNMYVTTAGNGGATLIAFERQPSGRSFPIEILLGEVDPGVSAINLQATVSPDDRHVYHLVRFRGLAWFTRDAETGLLTFIDMIDQDPFGNDLTRALSFVFSPDGRHLYLSDPANAGFAIYARDDVTGDLTFVNRRVSVAKMGDVPGISRVVAMAVSPDGAHVYSVSFGSVSSSGNALAVFTRNPVNGNVTHVETHFDGPATENALDRPGALAFSSDGAYLYVTGGSSDAVSVWARNASTGALTLLDVYGVRSGIKTLRNPQSIAVSPDGTEAYVVGFTKAGGGTLHVFRRDASSGALALAGELVQDQFGFQGLTSPSQVVAAPDGDTVYIVAGPGNESAFFEGANIGGGSISAFTRDACGSGHIAGSEQCDDGNTSDGDGCSAACSLEACAPAPRGDCHSLGATGSSRFQIKNRTPDNKDKLSWRWSKAATFVADLGDPLASASYALCVYDSSGQPQPLTTLAAPGGGSCFSDPCWTEEEGTRFEYLDEQLAPDGIEKASLRVLNGQGLLSFKGRGNALPDLALPLTPPVTVQLVNSETNVCWNATYADAQRNEAEQFKASN